MLSTVNKKESSSTLSPRVGFGGGCHWCTEAVFASLAGVTQVEQGFICSLAPENNYSEAVLVSFDSEKIPLEALIEIHLRTHASTSMHSMRKKYRSAIYSFSEEQSQQCNFIIEELQFLFSDPLITKVLPFVDFKQSQDRYKNYYVSDPARPFCVNRIDPKLKKLRQEFGLYVKPF